MKNTSTKLKNAKHHETMQSVDDKPINNDTTTTPIIQDVMATNKSSDSEGNLTAITITDQKNICFEKTGTNGYCATHVLLDLRNAVESTSSCNEGVDNQNKADDKTNNNGISTTPIIQDFVATNKSNDREDISTTATTGSSGSIMAPGSPAKKRKITDEDKLENLPKKPCLRRSKRILNMKNK